MAPIEPAPLSVGGLQGAIGVFDSGIGGLSVLKALRAEMPQERFIYWADSGYAPYGERSDEFVVARSHHITEQLLAKGEKLPVDFTNRVIYYVGPVDPMKGEAVGPAGPTTSTRMDKFTEMMLAQTGLIAMVGKAERGPEAIAAIQKHKSAYLMAVGGAAYLVSKAIKQSKVLAFADLGMEAIYEFDVVDMPVTVAVDSGGTSAHNTGPAEWQKRIATGEFKGIKVGAN